MRHSLVLFVGICLLATQSAQAAKQCGAGFAPPVSLPGFNFASAVASADFNRDGRRDLVVANTGVGSISVLLGNGSGGFTTHATYPSGTYSGSMAVGDFNRDGYDDVAVPNEGSGNVRVFLGTGTGALTSLGLVPAGASPRAVRTADFNRDGKLDLAVVNTSSATVTVNFGVGDGTFSAPWSFPVPNGPWSLTVADVNLDDRPDILVPSLGSGTNVITLLLGQPFVSTPFQAPVSIPTGNSPSGVAVGDLNRDGLPDLVVSNTGGANVSVHRATAPGVFGAGKTDYLAGNGPNAVRLADFNGDGLLDVVVSNESDDGVNVLYGNGNATLQPRVFFPAGDGSRNLEVADFNADGRFDLAVPNVSSNDVAILLGFNGTTSYSSFPVTGSTYSTGGDLPYGIATGDLNRDGKADLVAANYFGNSIGVLLASGSSGFGPVVTYHVPGNPTDVILADLNRDGVLDAVVATALGYVRILRGDGSGGFSDVGNLPTNAAGARQVIALDYNRDGFLDLAVIDATGITLMTSVFEGSGFSTASMSLPAPPVSLSSGDFDGDSKLDIAVGYNSGTNLLILRGNGAGGFTPAPFTVPDALYRSLETADLNLDGKLDLITATSAGIFTLLGNGNGTFQAPMITALPPSEFPLKIRVADFNADGKPDYVVTFSSGMMVTRRGDGNGGFTNDGGYSPGSEPANLAVADFNGDGRLDLAVLRSAADNIMILPNMAPFRPEVALTASTLTPALGQPVTFTATVSAGSPVCEIPTGNVYFQAGATGLGTFPLNGAGVASVTTSALPLGPVSVVAAYRGDVQFYPRESAQLSVTTTPPPAITTVTSSLNPSRLGQTVAFTVQVSGSNGVPTGTVVLRNGATTLTTLTLSPTGTASFSTFGLPIGVHSITASYSGDGLNGPGTSPVLTQTVNVYLGAITLVSSLNPAPEGRTVTLISYVSGIAPTGTITFRDGATVLGTTPLNNRAWTTLQVSNLSQGTRFITASYSGDSQNAPLTSSTTSLNVTAPEPPCTVPFSNPLNFPSGDGTYHVTSGDLNGDGRPDLAVANLWSNSVSVLLAAPGGGFLPAVAYPTGTNPRATAIGDFNRDGIPDLVTVGFNSLNYLRGLGNGTFAAATSLSLGHPTPQGIAAADLNSDGSLDVIVDASPNIAVRLGNGDGTFQPPQLYPAANTGAQLSGLAMADLDADGRLDIAIGVLSGTSVSVLTGNGLGGFSAATSYPAGSGAGVSVGPRGVTIGDFNKDGIPDLAVVNANNLAILPGTGAAAFGAPTTYAVGQGPYSAATGDFNGDGSPDLVVMNQSSHNVGLYRGNGDGTFQPALNFSAGAQPMVAAVADFNGDGKPDIAVSSQMSNDVSLLTSSGASSSTTVTLTSAPNPSLYGTAVTLTATLAGQSACALPAGTVTFLDGAVTLGTANLNSGIATLSISTLAVGTHSLTAVYSGDTNYTGSTSAAVSHVVNPAPQTILFGPLPAKTFGDAPFAVTATGGASGQPVTFTATGNCSVSGNIVTITGAGSCSVTASQLGDANYLAAAPVTQSFPIAKAAALLSFVPSSLNQTYDGTPRMVSVTTTPAGLPGVVVTYDGSTTLPVNPGSYAVVATLVNPNYGAAPLSGTLEILDATAPTITNITLTPNPAPLGSPVTLSALLSDTATGNSLIASADYSLDNGETWSPLAGAFGTAAELTGTATLDLPVGVHLVCVRATDALSNTTTECGALHVVYDPDGGFVTGGGWIDSPEGAFPADPTKSGKANFGFSSKYEPGANVPTGDTQFRFHAAGMQFKSTLYDWLVVAGARAQFKGVGTVNNVPGFGFLLTAIDGQQNGGGGKDKFRIKIWNIATEEIVYDNQIGKSDQGSDATELGGGSIIIHKR